MPIKRIWRELRKLPEQRDPELEAIRAAADNGNWAEFVELMGGPLVKRKDLPVKLERAFNSSKGRYGEPVGDQIIGLGFKGETIISLKHAWEIRFNPKNNRLETGSASDNNYTESRGEARTGNIHKKLAHSASYHLEFCQ